MRGHHLVAFGVGVLVGWLLLPTAISFVRGMGK